MCRPSRAHGKIPNAAEGAFCMAHSIKKRIGIPTALVFVLLTAAAFYGYWKWGGRPSTTRSELLAMMPAQASAIVFVDLQELRTAPFITQLYVWAAKPQADPDYAQFCKDTGFDYERDLARVAMAFEKKDHALFAVAEGNFDRQKISSFARKTGTVATSGAHEIFSVPIAGGPRIFSFTFLRNDRVALTNGSALSGFLSTPKLDPEIAEWRLRFQRLARSPVFAVLRHEADAAGALTAEAPGGLLSPHLSSLIEQLEWITVAGKPEKDRLRVTAEGDTSAAATSRQLADLLNSILVLAQVGLNDAKTRQQLSPATRAAYLDLLKTTSVETVDRGDLKSVRLSVEITPAFLASVRPAGPQGPGPTPPKSGPRASPPTGRT